MRPDGSRQRNRREAAELEASKHISSVSVVVCGSRGAEDANVDFLFVERQAHTVVDGAGGLVHRLLVGHRERFLSPPLLAAREEGRDLEQYRVDGVRHFLRQVHDAFGGRLLWSRGLCAEDECPSSADGRGADVQRLERCGRVEYVSLAAVFVADRAGGSMLSFALEKSRGHSSRRAVLVADMEAHLMHARQRQIPAHG